MDIAMNQLGLMIVALVVIIVLIMIVTGSADTMVSIFERAIGVIKFGG